MTEAEEAEKIRKELLTGKKAKVVLPKDLFAFGSESEVHRVHHGDEYLNLYGHEKSDATIKARAVLREFREKHPEEEPPPALIKAAKISADRGFSHYPTETEIQLQKTVEQLFEKLGIDFYTGEKIVDPIDDYEPAPLSKKAWARLNIETAAREHALKQSLPEIEMDLDWEPPRPPPDPYKTGPGRPAIGRQKVYEKKFKQPTLHEATGLSNEDLQKHLQGYFTTFPSRKDPKAGHKGFSVEHFMAYVNGTAAPEKRKQLPEQVQKMKDKLELQRINELLTKVYGYGIKPGSISFERSILDGVRRTI